MGRRRNFKTNNWQSTFAFLFVATLVRLHFYSISLLSIIGPFLPWRFWIGINVIQSQLMATIYRRCFPTERTSMHGPLICTSQPTALTIVARSLKSF